MMRSDLSGYSVVLVGSWNRAIFVPHWLKTHLGIEGDIGMEFAVGNPTMPARLFFDEMSMIVYDGKIVLSPITPAGRFLEKLETVSAALLRLLSHTPIRAAGVNFLFVEQTPSRTIRAIFDGADSKILADANIVVTRSLVQRVIKFQNRDIHLKYTMDEEGAARFDLNFHLDVHSSEEAATTLEGHVSQMHDSAIELLTAHFGLTLEDPND